MRLLLDTHALMWLLSGSAELSSNARAAIFDTHHEKLLSIASLWEITIKTGSGKLRLEQSLSGFLSQLESNPMIRQLPILSEHLLRLELLPRQRHGDPFDRLIVAQALSEGCTLVSRDKQLDGYGVSRLW